MKQPRKRITVTKDFVSAPALKKMKRLVKKQAEERQEGNNKEPQKLESMGTDDQGRKQYKIPDAPKTLEKEEGPEKKKKVGRITASITLNMGLQF